jgi:rod shape-determining protein MreD
MAVGVMEFAVGNVLRFLAALLPVTLSLLLVALANLPLSLTGGLLPAPILALASVYFWLIVRPDLMPPVAVLLIGFVEDLVSGGPVGLWSAGFIAAYTFTDRQRDVLEGLSSLGTLIGFAGAVCIAALTAYVLAWAVILHAPPLPPLLLECVMTVLLYPLVALPSGWLHRRIVGPMRDHE